MTWFSTKAASMETSAGICEMGAQVSGPVEAELFSIGGKQSISAFGWGQNGSGLLSSSGDVSFTVGWEVACSTTLKTQVFGSFLWGRQVVILKGPLWWGYGEKGLGQRLYWGPSRNDGQCRYAESA
jgi:hypothetical protein